MGAEGSRAPVVLAVDVGGDRAADGDVLGSGNDGQHPSGGHGGVKQLSDRDTGVCSDGTRGGVEVKALERRGVEHQPARQLGRVAVAAAHPPRDRVGPDRSARAGHEFVQLIGRAGTYQGHRSTLTAAPAAHAGVRPRRAGA